MIITEIYLDNAATTKPCESAVQACVMAMEQEYGNPSSLHKKGLGAERLVTEARATISKQVGCSPEEILFTSGATESNNLAIFGIVNSYKRNGTKIVTTEIEHPSVSEPIRFLSTHGYTVEYVQPNAKGEYTVADFVNAVDENTILVSCMHVNNETGLVLPVVAIADAVKRKNHSTVVHVDGVQSFMKIPMKLNRYNIDCMSFSGHKVYAPKGVGALYIRKGMRLIPEIFGGSQQKGMRAGTEAVPLIAAFAAAIESVDTLNFDYEELRQYLLNRLEEIDEVLVNSHEGCAPHIVNFSIPGIRSEIMLHHLEEDGIFVSSGSACSKGKKYHVFEALSIPLTVADSAIRISFGVHTTTAELDLLIEKIKEGIEVLFR